MDTKGFHIIDAAHPSQQPLYEEEDIGATGFYYVTQPGAWDDPAFSRRRQFLRLITLPVYIWRELLKGVVLALSVFSVVLMAVFAGQVMRDGIDAWTMVKIVPNFIPLICPFVLPLAILTGIIICYSRLAKDNEVLAAYAGGINPFWLMVPAMLTSVIAIFITLTLNEVALLPAIHNIERLVLDDQASILQNMITKPGNSTLLTGGEYIALSKISEEDDPLGRTPLDITRFVRPDGSKDQSKSNPYWDMKYPYPARRMVARDHEVHDFSHKGASEIVLNMEVTKPLLQDLHLSDINKTFIADSEKGEERLVLGGRPRVTIHSGRSAFWPILRLAESRKEAQERLAQLEAAQQREANLPPANRREYTQLMDSQRRTVLQRTSEINLRLTLCFSCLAFALLGIPLGMSTRGSLVVSFVIGILTAGVFFLAVKAAEAQVNKGFMPYWVIWIPDVLIVILGAVLWVVNTRRQ